MSDTSWALIKNISSLRMSSSHPSPRGPKSFTTELTVHQY